MYTAVREFGYFSTHDHLNVYQITFVNNFWYSCAGYSPMLLDKFQT